MGLGFEAHGRIQVDADDGQPTVVNANVRYAPIVPRGFDRRQAGLMWLAKLQRLALNGHERRQQRYRIHSRHSEA